MNVSEYYCWFGIYIDGDFIIIRSDTAVLLISSPNTTYIDTGETKMTISTSSTTVNASPVRHEHVTRKNKLSLYYFSAIVSCAVTAVVLVLLLLIIKYMYACLVSRNSCGLSLYKVRKCEITRLSSVYIATINCIPVTQTHKSCPNTGMYL